MDFDDILSDKPIPALVEETDEKPAESEAPSKEPEALAEPAAPLTAQSAESEGRFVRTVPHEALHAERQRRIEAEARAAEFERQLQQPSKAPTSVLEDEDKAFQERLAVASAPLQQRLFNLSVAHAKRVSGRDDYQDIYDFMNAEVKKDPSLMNQIDAAEDPGEAIYQLGKARKDLAEVGGDISKLREHATAQERSAHEQTKQQLKAAQAELAALKASKDRREGIPRSLNSEPSAPAKDEYFAGPTPLSSILN